jgi:hypothetical protein
MVGLTITGNPIATLAVGASNSTIRNVHHSKDIDAGKVVNTAFSYSERSKRTVTDISTTVTNDTPTDTIDTNSYCSCENSCSRWNRKSR